MKKTMYVLGIVAPVVVIIATIFKTQHWPGAGILLTLGLFTLGMIFLPMYVMVKIRDTREQKKPVNLSLYITGLIAGILFITGALFKIQHWPGAGFVIIISWIAALLIFVPILVVYTLKDKENRLTNFSFLIFLLSFMAVFYLTYALRVSKNVLDGFIITENSATSQVDFMKLQCDRILGDIGDAQPSEFVDNMKMIGTEADKICDFIHSVKVEMFNAVNPKNSRFTTGNKIDLWKVNAKDAMDVPVAVLMGETGRDGQAGKLKQMLEAYREMTLSHTNDRQLQSYIQAELSLVPPAASEYPTWEVYYFTRGPLVYTVNILSQIQNKVRLIELEILREQNTGVKE